MTSPDPALPPYGSYPPPVTGVYPPVPGYPAQPAYPTAAYPTAGYPVAGYQPPGGYPVPAYGPPFPGTYPVAPRNGMGTAGLVLGIIGIVMCWNGLGIVLGILAIIFGGVGLGRAKQGVATNRSSALTGLVLGIVTLALFVVVVIALVGSAGYSLYG